MDPVSIRQTASRWQPASDGNETPGGRRDEEASVTRQVVVHRAYLDCGRPVEVLTRWGPSGGPRDVLIRRETGGLVVRPFRGRRRSEPAGSAGRGRRLRPRAGGR
jgi:hypothetical protein